MLKDLLNEKRKLLNINASDWEDAIRKAAQPLVDEKKVTESYVDDIIVGVKNNGPYIILTEHVALPHARPESGALKVQSVLQHLKHLSNLVMKPTTQ